MSDGSAVDVSVDDAEKLSKEITALAIRTTEILELVGIGLKAKEARQSNDKIDVLIDKVKSIKSDLCLLYDVLVKV
jgi:hypothetical protein